MALNGVPVTILDVTTQVATSMSTPVLMGESGKGAFVRGVGAGSERTRSGKQALLDISRPAGDGTLGIYGADLPDALSGKPLGNAFAAAATETVAVKALAAAIAFGANAVLNATALLDTGATTAGFPAAISAAGVPTLLHVVVAAGTLLRCSATPAAGTATVPPEITFTVTAGVVTLYVGAVGTWAGTTPAPAGLDVVEYFVAAPTEILAVGLHSTERVRIRSRAIIFASFDAAITAGRSLVVVNHLAE